MGRLKVRRDRPAKRHGALTGIRQRWAVNALSVVMVVILVCFSAFTVGMIGYYYSNLQSSLEAKARTATDFFGSYVSQSYTEYYLSVYQYAQKFEEKDTLELQFINTGGAIISSSFGLTAGRSACSPAATPAPTSASWPCPARWSIPTVSWWASCALSPA